jgi:hypothetical protein
VLQGLSDDMTIFNRSRYGSELLKRTCGAKQNLHIREAVVWLNGAEGDSVYKGQGTEEIEDVVEAFSSEGAGSHDSCLFQLEEYPQFRMV